MAESWDACSTLGWLAFAELPFEFKGDAAELPELAWRGGLDRRTRQVGAQASLLASLGYRSVLARGYALVRDEAGRPVMQASAVAAGQGLALEFADGVRRVHAEGARQKPRPRPLVQTSLFDN